MGHECEPCHRLRRSPRHVIRIGMIDQLCRHDAGDKPKDTMTATMTESITATADTLSSTLARVRSQRGILQAASAQGDAYTLTVGQPATEATASKQSTPCIPTQASLLEMALAESKRRVARCLQLDKPAMPAPLPMVAA